MAACRKLVAEERAELAFCRLRYGSRQVMAASLVGDGHQRGVHLGASHRGMGSCPKPGSWAPERE